MPLWVIGPWSIHAVVAALINLAPNLHSGTARCWSPPPTPFTPPFIIINIPVIVVLSNFGAFLVWECEARVAVGFRCAFVLEKAYGSKQIYFRYVFMPGWFCCHFKHRHYLSSSVWKLPWMFCLIDLVCLFKPSYYCVTHQPLKQPWWFLMCWVALNVLAI